MHRWPHENNARETWWWRGILEEEEVNVQSTVGIFMASLTFKNGQEN